MLLLDLFLVGMGALAGGWVCRRFGVPEVLGYLGAGIALGHLIHGGGALDAAAITAIAQFAVVFRMFTLGLEFDPRRLKGRWRPALTAGVLEMGLCTVAGVLVSYALDWPLLHGAILGAALGTTSTNILSKALADRNMSTREDARAAGAATLVEDLLAMALIAVLVVTVDPGTQDLRPWEDAARNAFGLVVFAALAFTAGAIFVPAGLDRLGRSQSDELQTLAVLGVLFGFTALSEILLHAGRPVGAFLAGIAVGAARHAPGVSARVLPLRDVLAAVAYVSIGLLLTPGLILEVAPVAVLVALAFVPLKVLAITLGLRMGGVPLLTSARAGAILGQVGTMGIIVACRPFIGDEAAARLIAFAFCAWALTVGLTPLRLKYGPDLVESLARLLGARHRGPRHARSLARSPDARTRHDAFVACLAAGCAIALAALSALAAGAAQDYLPGFGAMGVQAVAGFGAGLLLLPFAFVVAMASRRALHRRVHRAVLRPSRLSRGARDGARAWSHAGTVAGLVAAFATSLAMGNVLAPPAARLPLLAGALAACALLALRRALLARLIDECEALVERRPQVDPRLHDFRGVSPFGFEVEAHVVRAESRAAWATLEELDLRKRTGATVVALLRPGSATPTSLEPTTRLHPGDELVVGGTPTQLVAAKRYVLEPAPSAGERAAGATDAAKA